MPRHSKERAPWRHVKYHRKRVVPTDQQSLHIIRHFRTKSSAFVWIITFRKTASRSFRYLSLSLQNGVLRNQGDTGVRALPTIKPGPITVQMVLLMTRLLYPAALSQRQQIPVCTLHKMSRKWTEQKFIQVSATVTGLCSFLVVMECDHKSILTESYSCHLNMLLIGDCFMHYRAKIMLTEVSRGCSFMAWACRSVVE